LKSMATAMHDFFRWDQYVGSMSALIWGVSLDVNNREYELTMSDWLQLGVDILRWSALAGPGGALMRLMQRRDRIILSRCGEAEAKKL
jgi:hypothetical protein